MNCVRFGVVVVLLHLLPFQGLCQTRDDHMRQAEEAAKRKDYKQAITSFTNAINLEPAEPGAYAGRASAFEKTKEYAKARADLEKVVQLTAGQADLLAAVTHLTLGYLLAACPDAKIRDGKKAVQYTTTAYELMEKAASGSKENAYIAGLHRPKFLAGRAAAYAESGDFEKAIQWQQKAVEAYDIDILKEQKVGTLKEKARQRLKLYKDRKCYHGEID